MIRNLVRSARSHYRLSVTVAAILPGLLATAVEYYLTDGVSGISSIVAALAGGIVTSIILAFVEPVKPTEPNMRSQVNENPDFTDVSQSFELSRGQTASGPLVKGRIYSPRTPVELVSAIEGITKIMADRINEPHLGQWLRVSGTVNDVSNEVDEINVFLTKTASQPYLALYFASKDWSQRLIVLRPGDTIHAEGEIAHISEYTVMLKHCELIG